jgi:hypothetical protein
MTTRSKIAVICDVGNNRFISLLLALVVITVEPGHGVSSIGTHAASFCYGLCRSISNCHGQEMFVALFFETNFLPVHNQIARS